MQKKQGFAQPIDKALIVKAQKGDKVAFESIYRTYANACFSLALRICGEKSTAEDILQTVFVKLFGSIKQFRHQGSFAGWLRRIVANESINRIRQNQKLALIDNEAIAEIEDQTSTFDANWVATIKDLDRLLSQLPSKARAVVLLHEVEGYSHQEIADMFGHSESFSKVALNRAFKTLKLMAENEFSRSKEHHNALDR